MSDRWRAVLLAAIVVAVFCRVPTFEFVELDDPQHLDDDPHLAPLSLSNLSALWTRSPGVTYVPLTRTLWALEGYLAGRPPRLASPAGTLHPHRFRPAVFHAANVLLRVLSTGLVFLLLRHLVAHDWGAFAGALLFAVHPMQAEPVCWVSATKDTLSGVFFFASLWLFLRVHTPRSRASYALSLACFALALLAKPSVVVLPGVLAAIAYFIRGQRVGSVVPQLFPWLLVALPFSPSLWGMQPAETLKFAAPSVWQRPLVALDAIGFYLGKLVFPAWLAVDYGRYPELVLDSGAVYLTGSIALALIALVWVLHRRRPVPSLAAGATVFLLALLPVLGLRPFLFQSVSTVADRYLYLPLLGVALAVAGATSAGWGYRGVRVACAAGLALLAVRTFVQTAVWKDSFALLHHAVEVNPRSWLAYDNLGVSYERVGKWDEAARYYLESARINPQPTTYNHLGSVRMAQKDLAGALVAFRTAIELNPYSAADYSNLGIVYEAMGKATEARLHFRRALELDRGQTEARAGLARLGM